MPPSPFSALPPLINTRRCTSMHFEENQLSRGLISLSPLPSTHPSGFQPTLVRTSIRCHPNFILVKGRSSRFASISSDWSPYSDSVSLRLRLFDFASPLKITSRLIMQKARGSTCLRNSGPTACRLTVSGSISLPSSGFFSPFPHGTGSLSV